MGTYKYQGSLDENKISATKKTQDNKGEEDWAFIGAAWFTKIIDFQSSSSSSLLLIWFYVYHELQILLFIVFSHERLILSF